MSLRECYSQACAAAGLGRGWLVMNRDSEPKPEASKPAKAGKPDRLKREAEALRANLLKRKNQLRAREASKKG